MIPEIDFSAGVRGKYFARYQHWTGITTATGSVELSITSTGDRSKPKIVQALPNYPSFLLSARTTSGAPEVRSTAAR